jgi:hypothetical protein
MITLEHKKRKRREEESTGIVGGLEGGLVRVVLGQALADFMDQQRVLHDPLHISYETGMGRGGTWRVGRSRGVGHGGSGGVEGWGMEGRVEGWGIFRKVSSAPPELVA